jgi:nucleotide-binding universal stress UspA family protein
MRFRKILVPLDGSEATERALDATLSLAKTLNAHVDALHVRADSKSAVPLLGEGMSGAMIEEMIQLADKESSARAVRAREAFGRQQTKHAVPTVSSPPGPGGPTICWREMVGREDEVTAHCGRLADLTVIPRPTSESSLGLSMVLNAAVFESGSPVMVIPPKLPDSLGKRIAIFWNGSAEASRAVASAMMLIEKADKVGVFTVGTDRTPAEGGGELRDFLLWHGVAAELKLLEREPDKVPAATLLAGTDAYGADLMVMGAYTRGRFRQLILGGVTQHVLNHATLPVLMSR